MCVLKQTCLFAGVRVVQRDCVCFRAWAYIVTNLRGALIQDGGLKAYLIGTTGTDQSFGVYCRDAVIYKTTDGGSTWSSPAVLFKCSGNMTYHTAPTPVLVDSTGRLRRAYEVNGVQGAVLVSTKEPYTRATDLLNPETWEQSQALLWNKSAMVPASWGKSTFVWEEGNAVEGPNGEIYDILRIDGQTATAHNKAAITQLDLATNQLKFVKMIDFPSCPSKFVIRRDPDTKNYYTLSTDVTPEAVAIDTIYARNHLTLSVSNDLFNWQFCDTLLTDDTGFEPPDSARFTGFHYVDWQFDGADIVFAARTGYRGESVEV